MSRFQSRIEPSSWPVATKQDLIKNVMHPISECSGANKTFMVSIFVESHNLMVLSSEHVIIFGSSGIFSCVFYSSLLGSNAMIFKMESVWPSIS